MGFRRGAWACAPGFRGLLFEEGSLLVLTGFPHGFGSVFQACGSPVRLPELRVGSAEVAGDLSFPVVVADSPELHQRVLVVGDGLLESFNGGQVGLTAADPAGSSIFAGSHVSPRRVTPSAGGRAARAAGAGRHAPR